MVQEIFGKATESHRIGVIHFFINLISFFDIILGEVIVYHNVVAIAIRVIDLLEERFDRVVIFLKFKSL